jgi:aryl sulfotransferase
VFSPQARYLYIRRDGPDMPGQMHRIADFLGIHVAARDWPVIEEHCSIDWMTRNGARSTPLGGAFRDGGAEVFINRGVHALHGHRAPQRRKTCGSHV